MDENPALLLCGSVIPVLCFKDSHGPHVAAILHSGARSIFHRSLPKGFHPLSRALGLACHGSCPLRPLESVSRTDCGVTPTVRLLPNTTGQCNRQLLSHKLYVVASLAEKPATQIANGQWQWHMATGKWGPLLSLPSASKSPCKCKCKGQCHLGTASPRAGFVTDSVPNISEYFRMFPNISEYFEIRGSLGIPNISRYFCIFPNGNSFVLGVLSCVLLYHCWHRNSPADS